MPNNTNQKTKIIYYDQIGPIFGFQPDGPYPIIEFDSYAQLVAHCIKAYGPEYGSSIEFHEVTEQNWHELHASGAFDW